MTYGRARRLVGVAAGIAALAVAWQLVPLRPRLPAVPRESDLPSLATPDAESDAEALLTYADIAGRNPFDSSRRAPRVRYLSAEARAEHAALSATPADLTLRLVGVAVGSAGAVALIDANPLIPGAEIYRVGDPVGSHRVVSIQDTAVVLRGASGTRTLRLESLTRRRS